MRLDLRLAFTLSVTVILGVLPSASPGEEPNPFKLLEPAVLRTREAVNSQIPRPAISKYVVLMDQFDAMMVDRGSNSVPSAHRIELVEQLIELAPFADERHHWVGQFARDVTIAALNGGVIKTERLALVEKLALAQGDDVSAATAAYAFAVLTQSLSLESSQSQIDCERVSAAYYVSLRDFVNRYPKSTEAANALYEIAQECVWTGRLEEAQQWCDRLLRELPDSDRAMLVRNTPVLAPAAP